jgi:Protein of unknown function with PCYCGC motif
MPQTTHYSQPPSFSSAALEFLSITPYSKYRPYNSSRKGCGNQWRSGEIFMHVIQKCSLLLILVAVAFGLLLLPQQSISGASHLLSAAEPQSADEVPAFHNEAPAGALPATMSADNFSDPLAQNAYALAAHVKKVLYQEPCYCHCDRSQGHESLLDCFVSKHGAGCGICVREDLYSYEQTHKGKTPAQIRAGIIQGEWQSVDVSKYQTPPVAHK